MRGLGVGLVNRAPWLTLFGAVALAGSVGCQQVDNRPAEWAYISENGYASLTQLWVWVPFAPDAATPSGLPCGVSNGTKVCEEQHRPLVTPYDPAGSRVVNMLRARNAPRMPPDRPLPELDIELVERWILNGALEYPGHVKADAGSDVKRLDAAVDGKHLDGATGDGKHLDGARTDGHPSDGSKTSVSDGSSDGKRG
jgi:hypothetical protein